MSRVLPVSFYSRPTLEVARDLVGAVLSSGEGDYLVEGRVVEVEAYLGRDDPASHAANGPTPRSAIMYGPPGRAYVYFIYGMHHCLNAVTEPEGTAGAVLIRAVEPLAGLDLMAVRRGRRLPPRRLCDGPAKLCRAFGVDLSCNGLPLDGGRLRLGPPQGPRPRIAVGRRIGIAKAADLPYRFCEAGSGFLSAPRG